MSYHVPNIIVKCFKLHLHWWFKQQQGGKLVSQVEDVVGGKQAANLRWGRTLPGSRGATLKPVLLTSDPSTRVKHFYWGINEVSHY